MACGACRREMAARHAPRDEKKGILILNITRTVNEHIDTKISEYQTGILILGKDRNYIKDQLANYVNIFINKIICADVVNTAEFFGLKNLLIIVPEPEQRKNALIAAVMASNNGTDAYIFTDKEFFAAKNLAKGVIYSPDKLIIAAVSAAAENIARGHELNLSGENFYAGFAADEAIETVVGLAAELTEGFKNAAVYVSHPAGFDFAPYRDLLNAAFFGFHTFYSLIYTNEDSDHFRADAFLKRSDVRAGR
jgi:hypothetical protein